MNFHGLTAESHPPVDEFGSDNEKREPKKHHSGGTGGPTSTSAAGPPPSNAPTPTASADTTATDTGAATSSFNAPAAMSTTDSGKWSSGRNVKPEKDADDTTQTEAESQSPRRRTLDVAAELEKSDIAARKLEGLPVVKRARIDYERLRPYVDPTPEAKDVPIVDDSDLDMEMAM